MEVPQTVGDMQKGYSIYPVLITVGLILIVIAGVLAGYELYTAKKFCNSVVGEYTLKLFPPPIVHYCNGEEISHYSDGWDFNNQREMNYSLTFP